MNKTNKKFNFLISILIIFLAVVLFWLYFAFKEKSIDQRACTLEAKLCPDGSAVGRTGPDCEFSPCRMTEPLESPENDWAVFTDMETGLTFSYPEKLPTEYVFSVVWPPKIELRQSEFICQPTAQTDSRSERVILLEKESLIFCRTANTGAAAGSAYTEYIYESETPTGLLSLSFTLQYPSCQNYEPVKEQQCQQEREEFDLDELIFKIFSSFKLK